MPEVLTRECTEFKEIKVYGYCGDYIFETIRKTEDFYEIGTLEKWTPYIGNVDVVFDVGANLGNHTLYWEKTLGVKRIFSFEPYEPNYENLVHNIRANHLEEKVFPIMKAVGEHDGMASITSVDQSNLGGTTFQYADEESDGNAEIVSLDGFVRENGIQSIGLIKIDTEGFEIGVLKGAMDTLRKERPVVWVEVSSESHEQVREMLESLQYDLADVEAFNMLFIPSEKNGKGLHVSPTKILDAMFQYETKTNFYYKNYVTSKRWYEDSKRKAEEILEESERIRKQLSTVEQNYQKVKEWHQASQAKNEALQTANEQLNKQLGATEQNYQKIKEWNQASQAKNETLKTAYEQLSKQVGATEQNYQKIKEWYQASQAKNETMKTANEQLSKQLEATEQNYQKIKEWYQASQAKNETMKTANEQLSKQLEATEQNYQKAKEWHQASQAKNETMKTANEQLSKQLEATEQNYQKVKEWHQASQVKNEALKTANGQLTRQLEEIEKNYQEVKKWNQANIEKVAAANEEISRQARRTAENEEVIAKLRCEAQKADENRIQLEEKISSEQKQIAQLDAQLSAKQQDLVQLRDLLDRYMSVVSQYVDSAPDEIEVAEALIKQLKQDGQTKEQYARLTAEFVDQSEKEEAFILDLMRHSNKLQAQVNYLKKENGQYRAKLDKITSVWYGRLGIKVYKTLKRVRANLFKR